VAKDPKMGRGAAFGQALRRSLFDQSYLGVSAQEEADLPKRVDIFQPEERSERIEPFLSFALGVNLKTESTQAGQYLHDLGYRSWKSGSNSKIPTLRRFENTIIRQVIPMIAEKAHIEEAKFRKMWKKFSKESAVFRSANPYEEKFVEEQIKPIIDEDFKKIKSKLNSGELLKSKVIEAIARDVGVEKWRKMSKKEKLERATYTVALMQFRRLPPSIRKKAFSRFTTVRPHEPDITSGKDLWDLVRIGRKIRAGAK